MLGIGWWCGKSRITGMTDFLLAGRRLDLVLCAGAMAATHFGGGALLGGAEYGFTHGLSGAWYGLSTGIGLAMLGLFTAKKFRALALFTVPDFLETRYGGRSIRLLGALLSVVALIGILAAQVKAAGFLPAPFCCQRCRHCKGRRIDRRRVLDRHQRGSGCCRNGRSGFIGCAVECGPGISLGAS